MNFKQNSLFTRNTGYEEEPMESQGGVLAVWGSPSSGKTVVSVKLADYLARKRKNVLLIFADMTAPPLPCICASSDLEGEKSLGSILAATHVTENLIKKNCMFYRKNDYLSMIGMLKGENVFTYPPYDQTQAAELIEQAREVAPYVIIDCGSTIASDVLSAVALMEADTVLRLVNCDLKSISYWRLLDRTRSGYHAGFEFKNNHYSTYNRRTHFTPIWMPDGTYTVYTYLLDCWTPDGMLCVNLTDSVRISGDLWDDWHIAPQKVR